ncbi:Chitinase-like protein [Emericellopsis cladophorae]|uniref:chitinase n=1 Tax=Emericellopsis cladophorae TaxID=2686198 RepID=A0A9P9XZH3_9HYPO|nr:Chitinase-like protein [Emericellopsis cladophorae]KAI6780315.1 Chitinase-like protein [Emericellopsis cladophorae]
MLFSLHQTLALLATVRVAVGLAHPVHNISLDASLDHSKRGTGYINAVYFTNWGIYGRNYQPADLPAQDITHVLYSFMNLDRSGRVFSGDIYADLQKHYPGDSWTESGHNAYGAVKQLFKVKKANRNVKVMLSIGGWTWSSNFPTAAATAASRANFAKCAVTLMKDWGFDGIDVDWEYPTTSTEANNMVLLLKRVRQELNSYAARYTPGHHFELSIAAPAGPQQFNKLKLRELGQVVDNINLMAYDYSGSWDGVAGHQANIWATKGTDKATPFNTRAAVDAYVGAGVPSYKIILGMPIYGRAFTNTHGPGSSFSGVGPGSWENGIWDYKDLPFPGSQRHYNKLLGATWTYDPKSRTMISYDTPAVVRQKVRFEKRRGLGGSMFWEASADKKGAESLILTAKNSMGSLARKQNCLSYPNSIYDNIRTGRV